MRVQNYKLKIKEKLLSWLVDHSWGDIKEILGLLLKFFSLIEQIIHKYTFLAKIIKVTGQNKLPFGYLSVIPYSESQHLLKRSSEI